MSCFSKAQKGKKYELSLKIILDATNIILGRLASIAAKKALLGEAVDIINCENAIITGNKKRTFDDYLYKLEMGSKSKGPFVYRRPDAFVKRAIRGMLQYKKENGRKAFDRIKCHIGVPDSLKGKNSEELKGMDISKLSVMKYTTVKEVCKKLGAKI